MRRLLLTWVLASCIGRIQTRLIQEGWWVAATSFDATQFALSDMCSLPNIVWVIKFERMRWAGHVARAEESRGVYKGLVGKPEGKRPLGRRRRRWEDNIKMELQELGYGGMDGIEMARDWNKCRALVNAVMNLRVS